MDLEFNKNKILSIKDNLLMEWSRDKVNKDGIVEMYIKEPSLLIKEMDLAICNGLMVHIIRDNGKMAYRMVMENYILTKLAW